MGDYEKDPVMTPLGTGSDDKEEPVSVASDRDYGEHQGDMEGSVTESDGQGDVVQECQGSPQAQPDE